MKRFNRRRPADAQPGFTSGVTYFNPNNAIKIKK